MLNLENTFVWEAPQLYVQFIDETMSGFNTNSTESVTTYYPVS